MLKAGFYEKEITPPLGDDIPGYSGPRRSTAIHDPLYVKAVAIATGEAVHECVIMIALDLINVPPAVYDFVMEKVERVTGTPPKNVLIAAVHTHTGGPIYDDGEFRTPDSAWMEMTRQSAADAAIMAYKRMTEATARFARTNVEGLAFCRDFVMKNGEIRTNPEMGDPNIVRPAGKNDPEFPVLFFFDTEGAPLGAITNYACHHDSKSGTEISADYSGVLAGRMKDMLGRNFINILFQGACGNINHRDPIANVKHNEPAFLRIGNKLAEVEAELYEKAKPFEIDAVFAEKRVIPIPRREIPEEMVDEAAWILENVPNDWYQMDISKPENQMFKRTHARAIIGVSKSHKYTPAFVQVVRLGELSIYAFPGEIYVEYGLQIKEKSPTKYNMVSGTALKGVKGYIPTPEVYDSTSYAVVLGSCNVVPEAGQMMVDKALEMAGEIDEAL